MLTPATLELLGSSILAACDAADGVADGVMTDPRQCGFRTTDLPRCADDRAADGCVTAAQLAAIDRVYDGPTANGESIHPGFNYGGENDQGGWDSWVVASPGRAAQGVPNAQFGFGTELFKYFVFGDPDWDYTRYDFANWREEVAPTAAILDAVDTDLSAFRDHGGKIIYWTGWSDLALTPLGTIDYFENLAAGDPGAGDYARPLHAAGRAALRRWPPVRTASDWVEAIRAWVEEGQAPERLVASKLARDGSPTMTRPVCPYPQVAVYDGTGEPSNEASFRLRRAVGSPAIALRGPARCTGPARLAGAARFARNCRGTRAGPRRSPGFAAPAWRDRNPCDSSDASWPPSGPLPASSPPRAEARRADPSPAPILPAWT